MAFLGIASACSRGDARNAPPAQATLPTGATAADQPEDGQWTMPARNYASTRYSGLNEITADNVRNLRVAWTFSTAVNRGQEAAPIVVGSMMYVVTPWPNVLYALDLTHPGSTKWVYRPNPAAASQGVACCDVVNRGVTFDNGHIYMNTLDDHTIALDAATGRVLWNTRLGDINKGETITMAPLVVKGKVLVGNSGGEMGVRGWLTALDAGTGHIAWRAFTTGPDSEVLIGPEFHPFYPQDRGHDLGIQTWNPDQWQIGGGTVWGWISYDPALDLIYYGTSNPGPWNHELRPGDNKWTAGVFARDPDDGHAHWYYQYNPHDLFDYDGVNENVLIDVPVNGQARHVLMHADRNGYMYQIDRTNGQVLSAAPYVHITSTRGVDPATGVLTTVKEMEPHAGRVARNVCPAAPGGKDWQPMSFSPRTGLLYIPHQNLCMDFEGVEASYIAGTPYVGASVRMYAGPGGNRGVLTAWDPVHQRAAWEVKENFPVWSGTVVTAGDVVFYGTMDGWFKAVNARTGAPLWQFKVGSGVIGQPVSYRGPDGHQYVAVLSGVGGWAGAVVAGDLDVRDATAALGFANAMRDLPQATTKGGTLYVFALPF